MIRSLSESHEEHAQAQRFEHCHCIHCAAGDLDEALREELPRLHTLSPCFRQEQIQPVLQGIPRGVERLQPGSRTAACPGHHVGLPFGLLGGVCPRQGRVEECSAKVEHFVVHLHALQDIEHCRILHSSRPTHSISKHTGEFHAAERGHIPGQPAVPRRTAAATAVQGHPPPHQQESGRVAQDNCYAGQAYGPPGGSRPPASTRLPPAEGAARRFAIWAEDRRGAKAKETNRGCLRHGSLSQHE